MKSETSPPSPQTCLAVVRWTVLPPELLSAIAGNIQNPTDIIRFRSVCQSWRFSVPPPPPNKISFLFPLKFSFCLNPHHYCKSVITKYLIAEAVYLLRPHHHPSKSWIVSAQESVAGKLSFRHPLTYEPISGNSIDDLSLWRVNRIAISCRFRAVVDDDESEFKNMCSHCRSFSVHAAPIHTTTKVVFVSNSNYSDAMAVYGVKGWTNWNMNLYAVRLCLSDQIGASQYVNGVDGIMDFVNYNGRIYVVDEWARVYVFDSTNMKLLPISKCDMFPYSSSDWKRFVVSDGDLYIVIELCLRPCDWPECRVFRLVMDGIGDATSYKVRKVLNLGGRVFFINNDSSFSVPARDLPPTLKGNCVIFKSDESRHCQCPQKKSDIYHLGGEPQESGLMSSVYVKSSLFDHPRRNSLRRGKRKLESSKEDRSC